MSSLGNFVWFICGGLISGLSWAIEGILWCLTIVGVPVGIQCFKMAKLSFFPFGKKVIYGISTISFIANVLWIIFGGIPLALEFMVIGVLFCITFVGIPFGVQMFKLARLALMPFGAEVKK